MKLLSQTKHRYRRNALFMSLFLVATLTLSACGGLSLGLSGSIEPPPTVTPTPTLTPTPEPTATPAPSNATDPSATPIPTPQVTIPDGWSVTKDDTRRYSLAMPSAWIQLDLRGSQFAQMAGMIGQGAQIADLQDFLDSEQGKSIGIVAIEPDMFALMQGKLPTLLNVSVIPLPAGITPDALIGLVEENMAQVSDFSDVAIEDIRVETINNLPGVRAEAIADLAGAGMDVQLAVTVVGLVANDQLYILTLATRQELATSKASEFDQIIGSFRPE